MSFTINHLTLVGVNLVRDAELKYMTSGSAKMSFDVAENRSYIKKETGEKVESTSYFKCVMWGKPAESLVGILKKGKKIAIDGRVDQRRWTDDQGATKSIVEIVVNSVVFMGAKPDNAKQAPVQNIPPQAHSADSVAVQPDFGIQTGYPDNPPTMDDSPLG